MIQLCILGISFWLSFAAVGFLIYGISSGKTEKGFFKKWLKPQLLVVLGLTPFTLFFFQQASLISPLANAIAIPWVGFVVVPLSLLTCLSFFISPTLAHGLLFLAESAVQFIWSVLSFLAKLPYANLHLYTIPPWALIVAFISLLYLLFPKKIPSRIPSSTLPQCPK